MRSFEAEIAASRHKTEGKKKDTCAKNFALGCDLLPQLGASYIETKPSKSKSSSLVRKQVPFLVSARRVHGREERLQVTQGLLHGFCHVAMPFDSSFF